MLICLHVTILGIANVMFVCVRLLVIVLSCVLAWLSFMVGSMV